MTTIESQLDPLLDRLTAIYGSNAYLTLDRVKSGQARYWRAYANGDSSDADTPEEAIEKLIATPALRAAKRKTDAEAALARAQAELAALESCKP